MIPSRGIRWSSQTIGIGRRRLETLSARSFSSGTIQRGPTSSNSQLPRTSALASRTSYRPHIIHTNTILQYGASRGFRSTAPAAALPVKDVISTQNTSNDIVPEAALNTSFDSATDLTTSLLDIPEHIGYLKSLGLDYGWGPTAIMEWLLEHVHVYAGTPWWASIAITAFVLRVAMFKPYMDAADNAARLAAASPITKPMTEKMTALTRAGDTAGAMQLRAEVQRVHKRAGIVMWKSFVPMIQMFAGYGTFVLLRGMGKLPVPGLETGGTLWFQNLAVADPYFLLPIATAGVLHWVLRRGGETGVNNMNPGLIKGLSYGLPAITMVFTSWLPAGLQFSFFISGLLSYGQSTLFRSPAFRARFNMQPLPVKNADPFQKPVEPSPYQDRIVVVPKSGYTTSPMPPSSSDPTYEAPRGTAASGKPGMIEGFKKEIKSTFESGRKAAKATIKSGQDMMGAGEKKDGKRTKAEIRAAEKYDEQRREEELQQRLAKDEMRRQKRNRG